jgi:plasmid maintenance system antidote protein VapI
MRTQEGGGQMQMKEVLHPGKILHYILFEDGRFSGCNEINMYYDSANYTNIPREKIQKFIECIIDIDYAIAYKLGCNIKGTDMAFWLKLQSDYDRYIQLKKLQNLVDIDPIKEEEQIKKEIESGAIY